MRRCQSALMAVVFLVASFIAMAQSDGEPDPAFGTTGLVLAPRSGIRAAGTINLGALAPAQDGAFWWTMVDDTGALLLGRRHADGSVDATFNAGAPWRLTDCVGNGSDGLFATADGGVLVWSGRCLLKRLADGSPDAAFGTSGRTDVEDMFDAQLARDASGRFVLAGDAAGSWRIRRFLHNGQIDTGYATNGVAMPAIPGTAGLGRVHALAVRPDGSAVVGGSRGNTQGPNMLLIGLRADGSLDSDFGTGGLLDVLAPPGFNSLVAEALLATGDGAVWVSGYASDGRVACCVLLARYDRSGHPDARVGLRTFELGASDIFPFFEMRTRLAAAPRGGVIIGRTSFPLVAGHRTQFTLVRLQRDGSLDSTFGTAGWRTWFILNPQNGHADGDYIQLHDMLLRDGKALLLGRTFFEDADTSGDFLSLLQVKFETLFADGSEP